MDCDDLSGNSYALPALKVSGSLRGVGVHVYQAIIFDYGWNVEKKITGWMKAGVEEGEDPLTAAIGLCLNLGLLNYTEIRECTVELHNSVIIKN